jgi:hypothetical protein
MTHAMQGWRIEVRGDLRYCARGAQWTPDQTDPNGPELHVRLFALTPQVLMGEGRALEFVHATAWPLRDTIYVSRPLTGDEPDTLRRLLDEEMRREREPQRITLPQREDVPCEVRERRLKIGIALHDAVAREPLTIALNAPSVTPTDAERDRVRETLEQLGKEWSAPQAIVTEAERGAMFEAAKLPRKRAARTDEQFAEHAEAAKRGALFYTAIDGWRDWACPWCRVMHHERSADTERFQCHSCGYSSPPHVPQVGDEIEVRAVGTTAWQLRRVERYGLSAADAEWFYTERFCGEAYSRGFHPRGNGVTWRWPEVKGE